MIEQSKTEKNKTEEKRLLSGMRSTGKLHLGHLSVLENWAQLQKEYQCYFFIADWHALTTAFDDTAMIKDNIREIALDWLAAGIDPKESAIFVQSSVKEHAELHLLLSMITPLSWLERVPSFKDQINQLKEQGKDISTYGFLGYPLLMTADVLLYRAYGVPVGEDQVPHLELSREIARRFNHLFGEVFPEPKALLPKIKLLPGTDNRKMSKSYDNYINLSAGEQEVSQKVSQMVTDPSRIKKTDPGHPDICAVYTYHKVYNEAGEPEVREACIGGQIGCVACKKLLAGKMNEVLAPVVERRVKFEGNPRLVDEILAAGAERARTQAQKTLQVVREAMKI